MADTSHTHTPTTPATPPAPEPLIAPKPTAPTPLDPPIVVYNTKWRVPPLVLSTQEELDALDPTEWIQNPPPAGAAAKAPDPEFPKIYYNINVAPKLIENADQEKALSGDWRQFSVPEDLIKSSQAKLDAAAKKPAASGTGQHHTSK